MTSLLLRKRFCFLSGIAATTLSTIAVYKFLQRRKQSRINQSRPFVVVSVLLEREDGKILVGRRGNTITLPGGHLKYGEDMESCASRELEEQTGISLPSIHFYTIDVTNELFQLKKKHYVTIIMKASIRRSQEAKILKPQKCSGWFWMSLKELLNISNELFVPLHIFGRRPSIVSKRDQKRVDDAYNSS